MTALDQWPDVKAEALRAGLRPVVEAVQLHLDNGYEPPLELTVRGQTADLHIERSRKGRERLVLYVDGVMYEAPAYRQVGADGGQRQTRSVFLPDDMYTAACELGAWADVARAAVREYLENHHPTWSKS